MWSFVVDFKALAIVAVKCDHVLCPLQFLFLQEMTEFKEQCMCIKLFFQFDKIQMSTFAFRDAAMRHTVVFDCSAESRNGMTSVKDAKYSGCLPTGRMYRNVEHTYRIWNESICVTIHKLANELASLLVYAIKF